MSIKVLFECDGCDAKTSSTPLQRQFVSVSGRSYGFGTWRYPSPQDAAPEGWIGFDPYTGCTYCPTCWHGIQHKDAG